MATKRNNGRKKSSRRKKKNQVQVPFPVVLANVLVLVTVLGLSYMWLCARCDALGHQIKELEVELIAAQKRTNAEQENWAKMTNPPNLREAIRKFGLNMTMPRDSQVVKVRRRNGEERTAMLDQQPLTYP